MSVEALRGQLPEPAKDIKLNLGSVLTEEGSPDLSQTQIWGCALASAYAMRDPKIIEGILQDAQQHLSEGDIKGVQAAHAIMSMNNVYYRFAHLSSDKDYLSMPANLRMNIMKDPGISKVDFELYSLAVSVINACSGCIDAHAKGLVKEDVSKRAVQSCARIAAVIHATSACLAMNS